MNSMKVLRLNKIIINKWISSLVPKYDIWFFRDIPKFKDVKIISIKEYLIQFDSLEYINAYEHWEVKKNAKFVIIDNSNWISSLNNKDRNFVYNEQIKLGRGLIISKPPLSSEQLKIGKYRNKLIISNTLFGLLNYKDKKDIAISYAKEQDDWDCFNFPKIDADYLKNIANTFVENDGCNCLAVVCFGITKDEQYLNKWVKQKEFNSILKKYNYKQVNTNKFKFGDVCVFVDYDNVTQHACFCLNNDLFINKSGQSKFNPIVVQKIENIKKDWKSFKFVIFRKCAET